jgi:endoglucanase
VDGLSLAPTPKHAPGATRVLWAVSRLTLAAVLALLLVAGLIATNALAHHDRGAANPFSGAKFFVDRGSNAYRAVRDLDEQGRHEDARLVEKIAGHSSATWLGGWTGGHSTFYAFVKARVAEIAADGSLPVLVAYNIPHRDCGQYSAGGARSAAAYVSWLRSLKRGIGKHRAAVILEPDALAGLDCLSPTRRRQRIALLRTAVRLLTSTPSVSVYIDAGNESWLSPRKIAGRLREVGIGRARGFALNVSNFYLTRDERTYGHRVSALVGNKPFVIDTSRNGRGPAPRQIWCNPPGRGLGQPATADTGDSLVDAYLWVKLPGESDGTCRGGPRAGKWWLQYALGLARRAAF